MGITILGIRHHGVGSARMVLDRLESIQPDLILIEGPPEIDQVMPYVGHPDLKPPVSILVYERDDPSHANFYPYAEFSPEWNAANYANRHGIPIHNIDLPAKYAFDKSYIEEASKSPVQKDPLSYFSDIAGFQSSESWWEYMFENNGQDEESEEHFDAVMLTMETLRNENVKSVLDQENVFREAYMRQLIRKFQKEYENIVVICGAWHAPALNISDHKVKDDKAILKRLPKSNIKIEASWIPWTNSRLSLYSGYGAGIKSPGWYEHLWNDPENYATTWLVKVSQLFRKQGIDTSSAHALETYKLAIALCQIRGKSRISIEELNEAMLTVMCSGDGILLQLINEELIINNKIGNVPTEIPKVPLQADFEKTIKSLRLKLSAAPKDQELDLRKPLDLRRSVLFHRLYFLNIQWAMKSRAKSKGTFKEIWKLMWNPEMMIDIVENAYLGNTIESATDQKIKQILRDSNNISDLTDLLEQVLPAEVNDNIEPILQKIHNLSTISSDIEDIMKVLPKLIHISRYGNVRNTDESALLTIVDKLLTKTCIGLSLACYGLDDDQSNEMFLLISGLQSAIKLHDHQDIWDLWHKSLYDIIDNEGIHRIIVGCACRLLLDGDQFSKEEIKKRLQYAISSSHEPKDVANWIEGFLRGSGLILIYDNELWDLIYAWIDQLDKDIFVLQLPYLRRAFSKFSKGERSKIGVKVANMEIIKSDRRTEYEVEINEEDGTYVFETLDYLTQYRKLK